MRALNSYGNSEKFRKKKDSVDFERILQKKERMWWLRKYGIFATIESTVYKELHADHETGAADNK